MTANLLQAPERGAIEAFLQRIDAGDVQRPTYERLLGFLSGVVITPGRFMPSDWMQPLLDMNGIVFADIDDANRFMGALMPLYNRVNAVRLRDENLCPFDLHDAANATAGHGLGHRSAWGIDTANGDLGSRRRRSAPCPRKIDGGDAGYHSISLVACRAPVYSGDRARSGSVPAESSKSRPRLAGGYVARGLGQELLELFKLFCLGRLKATTDALQRYAKAYAKGASAVSAMPPTVRKNAKVVRNERCPCGSGM
ncbi:MAG: hypothetical protein ED859_12705 [Desulfuromonadales bacterium]|nr:MAG: hypothetical protein ED859_12705 [Desulfuromonadales bacterium]